jgi:D-3-phosphoglycerate dehydrogenase
MSSIATPALAFNTATACDGPEEQDRLIRILIADPLAQEGIDLLRSKLPEAEIDERCGLSSEQLRDLISRYTVLIVRSQTRVTADLLAAAQHLKIIGRAGAGTDSIDLEAATRRGILVVNAPRGTVIAAAEHTIAMMMALARHIPIANNSTKAGQWEKSRFLGIELAHKVLGIVGLGKVGKEVAKRAQGLAMQVLASDPYVSAEQASRLGVPLLSLQEMLSQADVLTLHAPLIDGPHGTRRLIGRGELSLLKPGARLINCARGGLIDEAAVLSALREGRLSGVALDVYSQEPIGDHAVLRQLLADTRVIATPHLGASTAEAQVRVAREVAHRIVLVLLRECLHATRQIPLPPAHL